MKYPPKKVFILENEEYVEITYADLLWRTQHDVSYADRKFLPLHDMLMEVTQEDYYKFYSEADRQRYHNIRSIRRGDLSLDAPMLSDVYDRLLLADPSADTSDIVENKIMAEMLDAAILTLGKEEQLLIYRYYFSEMTERQLSELYGVSQQAISRRIQRIRRKLKEIIAKEL